MKHPVSAKPYPKLTFQRLHRAYFFLDYLVYAPFSNLRQFSVHTYECLKSRCIAGRNLNSHKLAGLEILSPIIRVKTQLSIEAFCNNIKKLLLLNSA